AAPASRERSSAAAPASPERSSAAAPLDDARRADLAASYQTALVRALLRGLERSWERAADASFSPSALVVGGGVAANSRLRAELASFAERRRVPLRIPPLPYCLDNAAMIAGLGALRAARGERDPLDLAPQPVTSIRS
ncbi:MAG: hypothetical protein FJ253_12635, partial [Phycisphaerae bacterium]|nr:hypothetical protein [Phycisphaerae bacterium]